MKAIVMERHGGTEVLCLKTVETPVPGPGQVAVRVCAAGVNPVDTYIRAGSQGYSADFPHTPGKDCAGTVAAVGEGVRHISVGDRVYCSGTLTGAYAETTICAAFQVHFLPDAVSFPEGACLGIPYGTAYRALVQRAGARPGEWVLVHGASGGVGIAAVQFARLLGMRIVGTASSADARERLLEEGAGLVLDHGDPDHLEKVFGATGKKGVDVILEMLASANLGGDLKVLAPGARVAVVGSHGEVPIAPRDLMAREAQVLGVALAKASAEELAEIHAAIGAGLASGALKPVVAKTFDLVNAPLAHEAVVGGGKFGNIVLTC